MPDVVVEPGVTLYCGIYGAQMTKSRFRGRNARLDVRQQADSLATRPATKLTGLYRRGAVRVPHRR